MAQGQGNSPSESALRRIVKEVDNVLEHDALIFTSVDRNEQVVGRDPVSLAVFHKRSCLELLWNLNVLRNTTEHLVGHSLAETNQDKP